MTLSAAICHWVAVLSSGSNIAVGSPTIYVKIMPQRNAPVASNTRQKKRSRSLIYFSIITFVVFCIINIYLVANLDRSFGGIGNNIISPSSGSIKIVNTLNQNNVTNNNDLVFEYFREAGVKLDDDVARRRLPSWSQIEALIGGNPVILGLDRCNDFRNNVSPLRRMLGSSGMFNSGTNLITRLMKENCVIPERYDKWGPDGTKEEYGIRWQCPWGKHTPVKFKYEHTAPKNENVTKDDCLPVVTIRNPFDWMKSMCVHYYTARWSMQESGIKGYICPHLVYAKKKKTPVELRVKLAEQWLFFDSLAHLWNEWYAQYWRDADFPFLIVRFEDLIFRQYNTTKIICECAGGKANSKSKFKYIVNSAKQGPGHGKKEERTGMIDAWIKYGKPQEVKAGFSDIDWEASLEFLSHDLMKKMGYGYPPSN